MSDSQSVLISRAGVFTVGIVAMILALDSSNSVLGIVSNAWAGFGAAFGPLVLFSLYSKKLTHQAAMTGMVVGAVTVIFCIYAPIFENGKHGKQLHLRNCTWVPIKQLINLVGHCVEQSTK